MAQKRAADNFVKANERLNDQRSTLKDARDEALRKALAAGVFAATLGKMSGLSNARMYQLVTEVRPTEPNEGTTP